MKILHYIIIVLGMVALVWLAYQVFTGTPRSGMTSRDTGPTANARTIAPAPRGSAAAAPE